MTKDGIIVIQARRFRTQERNRQDAIERLLDPPRGHGAAPRDAQRGRPPRRLDSKKRRSDIKAGRGGSRFDD